jgi:segregation and condensation protein B
VVGHKDVPGRPALFATTKKFLDDLNLRSLEELPPLHELQATLDMSALQAPVPAAPGLLDEAGAGIVAQSPAEPGSASLIDEQPEVPDSTLPVVAP